MSAKEHTPLPWIAEGHSIYGPVHPSSKHYNGRIFIATVSQGSRRSDEHLFGGADSFEYDSKADADFIVTAVNHHDELVETLEEAENELDWAHKEVGELGGALRKVRAVLAKVKGDSA